MDVVAWTKNSRFLYDAVRRNPLIAGRIRDQLTAQQDAPLAARIAFDQCRLTKILAAAGRSVYGRAHRGRPLAAWPTLEKQALRGRERSLLTRPPWLSAHGQTSGTTGTPLAVYRSFSSLVVEQVCIDRVAAKGGCDLRHARIAVLRGDNIKAPGDARPPYWKPAEGGRSLIFSASHLTQDNLDCYLAELRRFSPQCLYCYPSSLHALCAMLEMRGESLRIPLVLTSSEVLEPSTVTLAKRLLGCRFADFYGQCERVAFAEMTTAGGYAFTPGYAHVELAYSRADEDVDLYEIIGTNLWNGAMPLVRFRTGDLIAVPTGITAIQLDEIRYGLRPFTCIHGRDDGIFIHGAGGTRLFGMPKIMNGVRNVYQSQIVQESLDRVNIIIVPTLHFSSADREQILANARTKIPESIKVTIVTGQRLETTRAGKSPFIIRKIAN